VRLAGRPGDQRHGSSTGEHGLRHTGSERPRLVNRGHPDDIIGIDSVYALVHSPTANVLVAQIGVDWLKP
jgi:hypothetical protein